jgi:hypothetical protein
VFASFKLFDNKVRARIAGQELDIAEAVVGKWFALAFAYDAATGAFDPTSTVFRMPRAPFQCMVRRPYLMRLLGDQLREHNCACASAAVCYAKADFRQHGPSTSRRTDATLRVQEPHDPLRGEQRSTDAGVRLYGRYVTGERVAAWSNGAFAQLMRLSATYDGTRSLHFLQGGAGLGANLVLTNRIPHRRERWLLCRYGSK